MTKLKQLILEQLLEENYIESPKEFIREEIKYYLYKRKRLNEEQLQTIRRTEAESMIRTSAGKIFTVTFTKKDGTNRVMNVQLGVKRGLKGGILKYNPDQYNYLPVYDLNRQGYRMLNLNTILSLQIDGTVWRVI